MPPSPPSSRCGSRRRSTMSQAPQSSTASASKRLVSPILSHCLAPSPFSYSPCKEEETINVLRCCKIPRIHQTLLINEIEYLNQWMFGGAVHFKKKIKKRKQNSLSLLPRSLNLQLRTCKHLLLDEVLLPYLNHGTTPKSNELMILSR